MNFLPPSHLMLNCPLWAYTEFQQAVMEFRVVLLSANYEATSEGREPQELLGDPGRGEASRERKSTRLSTPRLGTRFGIAITNP